MAEFAHTVYRFGHSMLTGTVDRLENDLTAIDEGLSPTRPEDAARGVPQPAGHTSAAATILEQINANIIRGLSRDVGNAMDEFIVTNVRSNLLGLPLDLAMLNLSRGRETGIPSLNQTREQLYNDTGLADLKPYTAGRLCAEHQERGLGHQFHRGLRHACDHHRGDDACGQARGGGRARLRCRGGRRLLLRTSAIASPS